MDLTKRYWCFAYEKYYPGGGMEDLMMTTDDLAEAEKYTGGNAEFITAVDIETRTIIKE